MRLLLSIPLIKTTNAPRKALRPAQSAMLWSHLTPIFFFSSASERLVDQQSFSRGRL